MYYYIKGILVHKDTDFVVVDANGVGYKIHTSSSTIQGLDSQMNSEVLVYTYLHVREDAQILYGFKTREEHGMFLTLLSVNGVGPKAALSILSAATPSQLAAAVITDDVKAITKAQGVGPKLAQRIILELRDKIKNEDLDLTAYDVTTEEIPTTDSLNEAVSALAALGYSVQDAKKAVSGIDSSLSVEEIIKKALMKLF